MSQAMLAEPSRTELSATTGIRLITIEQVPKHGSLLQPFAGAEEPNIMGLNLMRGCPFRCVFCSVRASPSNIGSNNLSQYTSALSTLDDEIRSMRRQPKAVVLSPATDPFPTDGQIQRLTCQAVELLVKHGIEAWLVTRGEIKPFAFHMLTRHPSKVRFTIPLTTVDESLARGLEPGTAVPSMRLDQIQNLRGAGVRTRVSLEPLIPDVTDTRANLQPLLKSLADRGVRTVTTGYLFHRSGIEKQLRHELPAGIDADVLMAQFQTGPVISNGHLAAARYLPKRTRQRGFSRLMSLAAEFDIDVRINPLTNPDFCVRRESPKNAASRRLLLPLFAGKGM